MDSMRRLKSISVLIPVDRIQSSLSEMGFIPGGSVTIITDGKYWNRMLYVRGKETITVSDEIGDAYPKDPIITICGSGTTISKVIGSIDSQLAGS
jgi:Fe2+ transport system protein FeoA